MTDAAFLATERTVMRPIEGSLASERWLSWLNDPVVLRYRGRKAFATTRAQLDAYAETAGAGGDLALAVIRKEDGLHVGNVTLNGILWPHGTAELSIMIGEKTCWGQGYGGEVVAGVTDHAFLSMGLRRLWAESPNPSFNRVMARQGWTREGVKRAAFLVDGAYADVVCWGLLRAEYDEARA